MILNLFAWLVLVYVGFCIFLGAYRHRASQFPSSVNLGTAIFFLLVYAAALHRVIS